MTSMKKFIKDNRPEIDSEIRSICPGIKLNDAERREWIMNYESLYNWAASEGVKP